MNEEQQLAFLNYVKHFNDYVQAQFDLLVDILPPDYGDQFFNNATQFKQSTDQYAEILRGIGE